MKSLQTIQTLSKIGKIISKIVYICCMVGFIGCVIGIVAMSIGGNTLNSVEAGVSTGTVWAAIIAGLILCAGEYVVARMAYRYFDHELNAGTPFTLNGATELMRLGISAIWIPIVTTVLAQVAHGIISAVTENAEPLTTEGGDSVALGVMLIVMSVICRYGAELGANQTAEKQDSDEQN